LIDVKYSAGIRSREGQIINLFIAAFTASNGAEEGALMGDFVRRMLHGTAERDLFVFIAEDAGEIVGSVIFSRLIYDQDERIVFILLPLAVATEHQERGIGQMLVTYGLKALEAAHANVAVTYGDPGYYSKVGFSQISKTFAAAPFALTRPRWLAGTAVDRYGVSATEGFPALRRGSNQPRALVGFGRYPGSSWPSIGLPHSISSVSTTEHYPPLIQSCANGRLHADKPSGPVLRPVRD
jgi:predicted N-acetyltransferase YhbS